MKTIGYLGPVGTFSHEAVQKYTKLREGYQPVAYQSIPDMALAVDSGALDEAILPIENSLEGGVVATLDALMEDLDFRIKSELTLPIHQHLLARPGTETGDIRIILSHSQPLGQCRRYLNDNFPAAELRPVGSTSAAAEAVASGDGSTAAIGGAAAAEIYGLEILEPDIQDERQNSTRFIIIANEDWAYAGSCKTSVIFSVGHTPGSLHRALSIFNIWDINITRIESRPSKGRLGQYLFYMDLEGHREEQDMKDALKMLERNTPFYKFLGSYNCL